MPNRWLKADILTSDRWNTRRRWIPLAVRQAYWAKPCAVCGSNFKICVDHIVPLILGGTDAESNYQPLCEPCNLRKGGHLANEELLAWYQNNKESIDKDRRHRESRRFCNAYD